MRAKKEKIGKTKQLNSLEKLPGKVFLALALLLLAGASRSVMALQNDSLNFAGKPSVIHFTKKQFNSNSQFWTMCQDENGILYFGNNDGTLIFDGERWEKIKLPNGSSVRALMKSSTGLIYAGGYNEFGIIKRDAYGKHYYESMTHLLRPEDRNFENVWEIHEVQGSLVFRTYHLLIAISGTKAATLPGDEKFTYSNVIQGKLYVKEGPDLKLLNLHTLDFTPLTFDLQNESLCSFLPGFKSNEFIAITKPGSIFRVDSSLTKSTRLASLLAQPSSNLTLSAVKSRNGKYYVGTLSTQVVAFYPARHKVKIDRNLPELNNNTVLNLYEGDEGNIWALLNDGIDCIETASPVSSLFENASVYDVSVYNNQIYIAANQGVYVASADGSAPNFSHLMGLEGQAWSLRQCEGMFLCSHDRGLFQISGTRVKKILEGPGIWKVISIRSKPHYYLACSYEGMYLLEYNPSIGFIVKNKLEGFNESCRDILESDEPGIFWVCHGYKGVYRIKIDETFHRVTGLEHFKDKNGLPSPFNINVCQWNNQIVFTTNKGIFSYDKHKNRFVPHEFLTQTFGTSLNVRKLLQYGDKTWFVHDDEVGYFNTSELKPKLYKALFLPLKGTLNAGLECLVPLPSGNILVGTNMGLYHFNLKVDRPKQKIKTLINEVHYLNDNDQVKCVLSDGIDKPFQIPYKNSSVSFHFSAPASQQKMNVQYSCKLTGIRDEWSPWQSSPTKEYNLLHPGHYVFHVKAKNSIGDEAEEATYAFEILPVWYRTAWAMAAYVLMGGSVIMFGFKLVARKIERERKKAIEQEEQKRKVLELMINRIKLEQEKDEIKKNKDQLEVDVIHKSKELSNYTVLLVRKRELLTELLEQLKSLKDQVRNDASRQIIRDSIRKINMNLNDEQHTRVFETNFERVHYEFFEELKTYFPSLTQKELHLCALITMNLSNKQIALILNISVRGVETARYRIRKKLNLRPDEDLPEFFKKLYPAGSEKAEKKNADPEVA